MQDTPELTAAAEGELEPSQEPDAAATEASQGPEAEPSLEDLLKKTELAAQKHHDAWLRAKAEADNIRKRAQVEIANAHKFAVENFASEMLAVKDSLEAALTIDNAAADSMKSGVELTLKQLKSAFEKFNLAEINPVGQKFNPHHHQAISTVESDAEPNTVMQVLQKGYLLHERVIRPALVIVAKAKPVES
jgi:molecular chaperone GrpE